MSEKKINITADENMPALSACFGSVAKTKTLAGRDIKSGDIKDCDALLVRSITEVNQALLNDSEVQFIGSATIGTDHIDQAYLTEKGVRFAHAPGSNAQSVVEYVITAVALWCQKNNKTPDKLRFGIIGKGQIGSRLFHFLNDLGVKVFCCDPPLKRIGTAGTWSGLSEIQTCDVISCHVPLTRSGVDATYHLIDETFMAGMNAGALLINSSRGPVIDNQALLKCLEQNKFEAVLDVWETEPVIDEKLMDALFLATPHIAGYAFEAKIRGTFMLYQAFCQYFDVACEVEFEELLPSKKLQVRFKSAQDWFDQVGAFYDIKADDALMRRSIKSNPQSFDSLRKNYPQRREFLKLD